MNKQILKKKKNILHHCQTKHPKLSFAGAIFEQLVKQTARSCIEHQWQPHFFVAQNTAVGQNQWNPIVVGRQIHRYVRTYASGWIESDHWGLTDLDFGF